MADQQALDLVQEEKYLQFNDMVEASANPIDLSGAHLRGYDLRKFQLSNANLSGAYLRGSDLRGLDLSQANLEGASLRDAKVSGVLFPKTILPEELMLSLTHGTRLRYQS